MSKAMTSSDPMNAATPGHPAALQNQPPQYPTMLEPR
jgi:hypothetical protein